MAPTTFTNGHVSSGLNTPESELESIVQIPVHPTAVRRPYPLVVNSENTNYTDEHITATFINRGADVTTTPSGQLLVTPTAQSYQFRTERQVGKTGYVMSTLDRNQRL
jgi:myo-inositol-1-phosphate synthase